MTRLIFIIELLLPSVAFASDFVAPFQGIGDLCSEQMVSKNTILCVDGTVDGSGNLIDATENMLGSSDGTTVVGYVVRSNATLAANKCYAPDGTCTAYLAHVEAPGNDIYQYMGTTATVGDPVSVSFYIKRVSKTGLLRIPNPRGAAYGNWNVDFSKLSDGWERISRNHHAVNVVTEHSVDGTGQAGINFYVDVASTNPTMDFYFWIPQVEVGDRYHVGPPIATNGGIEKPRLSLTPTGAPPSILSDVQDANGNKKMARSFNGTSQYYTRTHDEIMDMWDANHTYTAVIRKTQDTSLLCPFWNGLSSRGFFVYLDTGSAVRCIYGSATGSVTVYGAATFDENLYHVVQIVRNNDYATVYVDGAPGTPTSVAGKGEGNDRDLILGAYNGSAYLFAGDILYTKIESTALSEDELSRQADYLMGMFCSSSRYEDGIWNVSRTTTATQEFSNKTLGTKAVDHARVGDGILVEGQATNSAIYSQQLDQWTAHRLSVIPNTSAILAPDGTQTVDILHEDSTLANTHYIYPAGNVTVTSGEHYTWSAYIKPINRSWVQMNMYGAGLISGQAYFNVTTGQVGTINGAAHIEKSVNGFYRVVLTQIAAGTGTLTTIPRIYIAEADNDTTFDGLDQDSLYVWQAQFEEGLYPTSPIVTGATAVTRTADDVTFDPHQNPTYETLPNTISGPFTIQFDAKCEYADNTQIDASKTILSISGNQETADIDTNNFEVFIDSDGKINARLYDSASSSHYMQSAADPTDFSEWFKVKAYLDLSDLTTMDMWVNGSNASITKSGNTGTATWSTLFNKIRIGQNYAGNSGISGDCKIRNLRISPRQF